MPSILCNEILNLIQIKLAGFRANYSWTSLSRLSLVEKVATNERQLNSDKAFPSRTDVKPDIQVNHSIRQLYTFNTLCSLRTGLHRLR